MTERQPEDAFKNKEVLDPRHAYLAYIFDKPEHQLYNIAPFISKATELGYPVRYWWLSEAMDIASHDMPDRLILCVHHPSRDEDAGMDLYSLLQDMEVDWSELEAATYEEYLTYGKSIASPAKIDRADGEALFPKLRLPFVNWIAGETMLELQLRVDNLFLSSLSEAEREQVNAMLGSVLDIAATITREKKTLAQYGGRSLNEQLKSVAESFRRTANFYRIHWPHVIRRTIEEDELPFD